MNYENILYTQDNKVILITLNRPDAMNALSDELMRELAHALGVAESDEGVGCIVITGSPKAFAAGADIKAMSEKTYMQAYKQNFITDCWERTALCKKPVIAAVGGYALGGGCELAMMCDMIFAADNAKFGQPEITIGTVPGIGGTQRLTRCVGKAKAMEMCLTGRMMGAQEAESSGLVTRVIPQDELLDETMKVAAEIAQKSLPMAMMVKSAINMAMETPLAAGLTYERHLFHASFATRDQKEGMSAFIEKRDPDFANE